MSIDKTLNKFLENLEVGQEYCDKDTGICYIKKPSGLIERKIIEKKLIVEDGRQLLTEELPISNTNKTYLR